MGTTRPPPEEYRGAYPESTVPPTGGGGCMEALGGLAEMQLLGGGGEGRN